MKIENKFSDRVMILLVLSIILVSSFVNAFAVGVSGDVNMYPGQVLDTGFDIMNTIGGGDLVVEGQFLEGGNIASFTQGSRFNVPAKSVVAVPARYKIPGNAAVGTAYTIKVIFKTVSEGTGSGSISFAEDVVGTLKINIVGKPAGISEEKPAEIPPERASVFSSAWFWIIIIIVIIIILWLVLKMKKK